MTRHPVLLPSSLPLPPFPHLSLRRGFRELGPAAQRALGFKGKRLGALPKAGPAEDRGKSPAKGARFPIQPRNFEGLPDLQRLFR